jgi:hypothetical protein
VPVWVKRIHVETTGPERAASERSNSKVKLRIDTAGMTFMAAGPPEPVLDFETKKPKPDETGEQLFGLQLVVLAEGNADVIGVKVPGEPKGVGQGATVKVTGLVAQPWSMGDRSGVAFRAASIEVLGAPSSSPSGKAA